DSFAAASQPDSPGATAGPTAPAPRGDAHVAAAIWSGPFWTEAPAAVAETQAAEDVAEPEAITESQSVVAPASFARPQAVGEPEVFVEPEAFVEPEVFVDTEVFIDPEAFVESEATESEASTDPAGEAHFWAGAPAAAAEFPGEFSWDQASREPRPVQPAAAEVESADEARWGSAVRNAEQISASVDRDWLAAMETRTDRAAAPDPLNSLRVAGLDGGSEMDRLIAQSGDEDFGVTGRTGTLKRPSGTLTTFSLDVQEADIHTVLRSIAEYAGVNIVADNNVDGNLTICARDLTWPQMLDAVCEASGLVFVDHGSVIRVATQKTAREDALSLESAARKQEEYMPLITRVILIDYANAKELQETLSKFISARGHIEMDPRTNALILTDIAPRLEELEAMIRRLDSETIQVEIAAKIVDVDAYAARQLGISWGVDDVHSSSANASGSVHVQADDVLDPVSEVQIGVIRSFGEIQAKLQALEDANQAEIISAPRITTVNNRQARILVGKEVPLITLDFAGNAITELKKVGITLEVVPHVNEDGLITMDIHPEVSDLTSQATVQGGVVFTTTEADTRVVVTDGGTAVIGGLIRSSQIEYERGVPYLRDIPLLGHLFKSSNTRTEKREMLIFITPRLINN
ncbi:MAG: type IV pilus secretin PilQ, partial [Candidatus Eisenbacteria bacterium]